jgi:DNA-binding CsgD family transcriptional regulator
VGYVSAGDYEQILAIIAESASGTIEEPVPRQALEMIRRLIPCDVAAVFDGPPGGRDIRAWSSGWSPPWTTEDRQVIRRYRFQMALGPTPATIRGPIRITDMMSQAQYRGTDIYQLVGRSHGVEFSMEFWIPGRAGRIRALNFDSSRHDFSDRDRDVVEVLGRHLAAVLGRFDPQLPATPARQNVTSRQAEILALVADGRTNRQIAEALSISPLTVKKHLENAFSLMGVNSRAAAIAVLYERVRSGSGGFIVGSPAGGDLEP